MSAIASIIVLTNLAFTAAYDTETRCPAWVAYDLDPHEVVVTNRAQAPFMTDHRVPKSSDNAADYSGSGFDRGHMAPAADFNFDMASLFETYRYTNIAPQRPKLNRGRWSEIEAEVRGFAKQGTVHVVTAPIFVFEPTNRIGRIAIPDAFVKVAYGAFGFRVWIEGNR